MFHTAKIVYDIFWKEFEIFRGFCMMRSMVRSLFHQVIFGFSKQLIYETATSF